MKPVTLELEHLAGDLQALADVARSNAPEPVTVQGFDASKHYVALFSDGVEISWPGYQRLAIDPLTQVAEKTIEFPVAKSAWGIIDAVKFYDASGTVLMDVAIEKTEVDAGNALRLDLSFNTL